MMETKDKTIEEMAAETDDFLTMLEQEVQAKNYRKIRKLSHPDREMLYDYVLGDLHDSEADEIQEHMAWCPACTQEVLCIMRFEKELEQPEAEELDWVSRVKDVIALPSHVIKWISDFWQPQWAGETVFASDIPEQKKMFRVKDGEIEISCVWRAQYKTTPAYIQIGWTANFEAVGELWTLFLDPDTKDVLAEIPLGAYLEGDKNLSSEKLGFDPSNRKWAIAILVKEKST